MELNERNQNIVSELQADVRKEIIFLAKHLYDTENAGNAIVYAGVLGLVCSTYMSRFCGMDPMQCVDDFESIAHVKDWLTAVSSGAFIAKDMISGLACDFIQMSTFMKTDPDTLNTYAAVDSASARNVLRECAESDDGGAYGRILTLVAIGKLARSNKIVFIGDSFVCTEDTVNNEVLNPALHRIIDISDNDMPKYLDQLIYDSMLPLLQAYLRYNECSDDRLLKARQFVQLFTGALSAMSTLSSMTGWKKEAQNSRIDAIAHMAVSDIMDKTSTVGGAASNNGLAVMCSIVEFLSTEIANVLASRKNGTTEIGDDVLVADLILRVNQNKSNDVSRLEAFARAARDVSHEANSIFKSIES